MDFAPNPIRKARERCWIQELQTTFSFGLDGRIGEELKAKIRILLVLLNVHLCQKNITLIIVEVITTVSHFFHQNNF